MATDQTSDQASEESIADRPLRRRKQPCPIRIIQDPFALSEALERDVSDECCKVDVRTFDNHICGQCSGEFFTMPAFLVHKRHCTNEWPVLLPQKKEDDPLTGISEEAGDSSDCQQENGHDRAEEGEEAEALNLCVSSGGDPPSNFDLVADERTMFTPSLSPDGVAQIQSALRSLQGQQMVQLQLIQQIYSQLLSAGANTTSTDTSRISKSIRSDRLGSAEINIDHAAAIDCTSAVTSSAQFPGLACNILSPPASGSDTSPEQQPTEQQRSLFDIQQEMAKSNDVSAFDALKSQVINSLKEMEQSVEQQIREQRKADTYLDKLYRHRCHFCGKIMSSESSLQIHIRSHTGERPYACAICDSRFSTKGNLKVHMDVHRGEEAAFEGDQPFRFGNSFGALAHSESICRNEKRPLDFKALLRKANSFQRLDTDMGPSEQSYHQKTRARSASMSESRERLTSAHIFRDDSMIGKRTNFFETVARPNSFNGDDRDDIKDDENMDLSGNAFASHGTTTDSGMMPIDLRVSSTLSSCHSKSPLPTSVPLVTPTMLSAPFFSPLSGLYPNPLTAPSASQTKSASHLQSPLFMNQPPTLLKLSGLDNAAAIGAAASNTAPSTPISPSNGADFEEDWESMMEITTTDEAEKIRSLVGDRETKVTDPNQCIICHRILSCKSALQMHYRTHTGERPFKCKICSRAFTTKGNLKTHMGVHRTKPPFRLFHQCPICHKKFNNGIVLQQHIRLHTGQAPDMPIEHIQASEIKETTRPPAVDFDRSFPTRPQQAPVAHNSVPLLQSPIAMAAVNEQASKLPSSTLVSPAATPKPFERTLSTSSSTGNSSLPAPNKPQSPSSSEKAASRSSQQQDSKLPAFSPFAAPPLDLLRSPAGTAAAFASWLSRLGPSPFPLMPFSTSPPTLPSTNTGSAAQSQGSSNGSRSAAPPAPPALTLPATNPFTPVILPNPPQPPMFGRPNTTCNICFKTFACNSALEIHYRSHTKERPFKCTVCNRGFSTKGNMKQHLLTHKIRDAPTVDLSQSSSSQNARPSSTTRSTNSDMPSPEDSQKQTSNSPPQLAVNARSTTTIGYGDRRSPDGIAIDSGCTNNGETSRPPHLHRERSPKAENRLHENGQDGRNANSLSILKSSERQADKKKSDENGGPTPLESIQSMWARTESLATSSSSPATKRPPVLSKHQCQVCYKHFSSSSALAIHMRTHTGERPFCCPACGRSFTTKGNLKVHMGTHSWQHAQSRRGRRIFDTQQSPSFGFGEQQSAYVGDRSSTATSLSIEDASNASSANSDTDHGNGRHTSSPGVDGQSRDAFKNGSGAKHEEAKKRRTGSPSRSRASTPSQLDNGLLSPTSLRAASLLSNFSSASTSPLLQRSPGSSFLASKPNLQNGQMGSLFANPVPVFPTGMSPSSSFAFMNAFQPGATIPTSSPPFGPNGGAPNPMSMADPSGQFGNGNPMQTMLWMWRNVCSVCRHVCSSVSELEDHLKLHLANSGGANDKIATSIPT